jgi:transcriptional regulator GlxA family with amidase domain
LLSQFHNFGTLIGSICTGAFALGEAGLLDGRPCTTCWINIDLLRRSYPNAHVVDNVLFVSDRNVTTSAGIASGIDMALWLVEQDMGAIFAAKIARHMVVYLRRDGNQPQHSTYLDYRTHLNQGVHNAQDFIIAHVSERITLDEIA